MKTFLEWRKANHPMMRRTAPVALTHSGGTVRKYTCLCGASVTMCAKWRMPRRVEQWIAEHNVACLPTEVRQAREAALVRIVQRAIPLLVRLGDTVRDDGDRVGVRERRGDDHTPALVVALVVEVLGDAHELLSALGADVPNGYPTQFKTAGGAQ